MTANDIAQDERTKALAAIAEQMVRHDFSFPDLAQAMESVKRDGSGGVSGKSGLGDVAARLFSTLGGIFVFSGIGVYVSMFWGDMNSTMRIIATLGIGLVMHALIMLALRKELYVRTVKPLLLISAFLQTAGWFVALDELMPRGNDERYAILFVMGVMLVQQGTAFLKHRITILLFGTLFFGYSFVAVCLDLLDANEKLTAIGFGVSMIAIAHAIRPTKHAVLSALGDLAGAFLFCFGLFELVKHSALEILYLGAVCGLIYISTFVRSTALLIASTFAMLGYIGYFTSEHFVDSVGWPLSLVILGMVFFGVSVFMLRVKRRYIS